MRLACALALWLIPVSVGLATDIQAVRIQQGPRIDGYLTDPVWQSAVPFSEFRQVEPEPDADPTEKTELRVLFDESNLYIGVLCWYREPRR